jgi:hypothetical protein
MDHLPREQQISEVGLIDLFMHLNGIHDSPPLASKQHGIS